MTFQTSKQSPKHNFDKYLLLQNTCKTLQKYASMKPHCKTDLFASFPNIKIHHISVTKDSERNMQQRFGMVDLRPPQNVIYLLQDGVHSPNL